VTEHSAATVPERRRIPLLRPTLGEAGAQAVADAVRYGWVAQGPRVAEFERAFAQAVGAKRGVAVSSCTAALGISRRLADTSRAATKLGFKAEVGFHAGLRDLVRWWESSK
jgi:dTDP-4-amino-4,6-dideoxygalactose transaminase